MSQRRRFALVALALMLCVAAAEQSAAAASADAKVIASGRQFPEGTIFVGDDLYFVDYVTSDVFRLANGKVERIWHQNGCGADGLVAVGGELLVTCYDSGAIVRISVAGLTKAIIGHDDAGGAFASPNDLAADAAGGVYFSASGAGQGAGKIYYRDPAGHIKAVADNIDYANGVAVSNDGRVLYVGESHKDRLLTYDIGPGGSLSHRAVFADLAGILSNGRQGRFTPDGIRVDRHGRLFVALYDGGGFAILSPGGKLETMARLPAAHHSNLAISPDGKSVVVTAIEDTPDGAGRGWLLTVPNPVND
jgi:gluconolactonase